MEPFDHREELARIFRKYLNGTATPEEKQFVEAWYGSFEKEPGALDSYTEADQELLESRMEQMLRQHTESSLPGPAWKRLARTFTPGRAAAAAVLILALAGSWYYYSERKKGLSDIQNTAVRQDLLPGGDRATLTLSDGSQIGLDTVSPGMLARQGNTLIHKVEEGLISYTGKNTQPNGEINTISAPAGGKYSVVLSDGSRVWLNAESSVSFPTSFTAQERSVKVSGEVYFEIAKDARRPFCVQVGELQKVRVLGTHFNINAYCDEEAVTTTLLEGSVEITAASGSTGPVMLKPGEQAALSETGRIRVREDINTEEIVAWKNGMFQFEKTGIRNIMRQLSRWYNVEVVYEGTVPDKNFSGKIDRGVNASEVLDILHFAGLNFRIDALPSGAKKGKIIVLP